MTQHIETDRTNVLRNHISSSLDKSICLRAEGEIDGRTRRRAVAYQLCKVAQVIIFWRACCEDDIEDILLDLFVHINFADNGTGFQDLVRRDNGLHRGCRAAHVGAHDQQFFFLRRVADFDLEHKAVDLRFGERICSFLLDRVLRCEHKERLRQLKCLLADCHLALLHGFEQRALHLGRRAVDFIGEDEVREDRPLLCLERTLLLIINHRTHEIGGKQVGGKLDALELRLYRGGKSLDAQRLCQTRHAFK